MAGNGAGDRCWCGPPDDQDCPLVLSHERAGRLAGVGTPCQDTFTGTHAPRPQRRSSSSVTTYDADPSSADTPRGNPRHAQNIPLLHMQISSSAHAMREPHVRCSMRGSTSSAAQQLEAAEHLIFICLKLPAGDLKFHMPRSVPTSPGTSPPHR